MQPKVDRQGIKNPIIEFLWIGPYNIEKALSHNNYLVRKIGTNKTQVPHRMRMRQVTARQPRNDIRITPQQWKPDPEVSLKHDDLYARAWEFDYEQPNFDAENNNATPPNAHEIPVQSDVSTEERRNTPGTARQYFPKFFLKRKK